MKYNKFVKTPHFYETHAGKIIDIILFLLGAGLAGLVLAANIMH